MELIGKSSMYRLSVIISMRNKSLKMKEHHRPHQRRRDMAEICRPPSMLTKLKCSEAYASTQLDASPTEMASRAG